MKHRNINERKVIRKEFVYKHRVELLALYHKHHDGNNYFNMKLSDREKEFVGMMRDEIGYSPKTCDYDIYFSNIRLLKQLLTSLNQYNYDTFPPTATTNEPSECQQATEKIQTIGPEEGVSLLSPD